jgi:hypothetical protein
MFFQLLFIHLFRPFLKYKQSTSPLPAHVSPRKFCTQAASTISKLLRLYKRTYGLRQIVNIAVYILHSACTIHLLNLPEKNAERDIVHGLKHLEEISESWLCARKTLAILQASSRRWNILLPKDAGKVFHRTETKFGDQLSPKIETTSLQHHNPIPSLATTKNPDPAFPNPITAAYPAPPPILSTAPIPEPQRAPVPAPPLPVPTTTTATKFPSKPRRQSYAPLPPHQQDLWNADRLSRNQPLAAQTSPGVLFGGVDALMQDSQMQDSQVQDSQVQDSQVQDSQVQDSQDWWYKNEPQLFANWNAMEAPPGQDNAGLMVAMEGVVGQGGYGPGAGAGAGGQTVFAGAGYGMNGGGGGFVTRDSIL